MFCDANLSDEEIAALRVCDTDKMSSYYDYPFITNMKQHIKIYEVLSEFKIQIKFFFQDEFGMSHICDVVKMSFYWN